MLWILTNTYNAMLIQYGCTRMKCGNICEQKMKVYSKLVVSAACINANKILSLSLNPLIRKFLEENEFSKFEIVDGDLE